MVSQIVGHVQSTTSQLPTQEKNFQLPESTPKKCVTLAGEADSARFTLSVGKMAHGRCQLTEIYSGDSTCIQMGKLNTLILVRKLYSKLRNAEESMSVLPYPGPRFGSHLQEGMSPDWLASLTSFTHFSLQLLQDGEMEKLEELVGKYPRAFPCWVGPFQVFFYIYDPDYAKAFLSRTGKKRDESWEPILLGGICTTHRQDSKGILKQRLISGLY